MVGKWLTKKEEDQRKNKEACFFLFTLFYLFDVTITLTTFLVSPHVIERNPIPRYMIENNLMFVYVPLSYIIARFLFDKFWFSKDFRRAIYVFLIIHLMICVNNIFVFMRLR